MKAGRLIMVLSSFSPLFLIWAVRGSKLIPDHYFVTACVAMIIAPTGYLLLRLKVAKKNRETRVIKVGRAEDHRDHLLVYLFAMLLPLYPVNFASWRGFSAGLIALAFLVFLFWQLDLHYMNVLFAFAGYRVFTVYPPDDANPFTGKQSRVVLTPRSMIFAGYDLRVYLLSDTVYWEAADGA